MAAAPTVEGPSHDVVVVGASAGGVEALRRLIGALDPSFDGTMFVVLHLPTNAHSALPAILDRAGPVPVRSAVDGLVPERGLLYFAPPDAHLLLERDGMQLLKGPTENGHRPAIDPLFRSTSSAFGSRVIGVVLSGVLDDGTKGLLSIAARGGLTVVQDPDDALYASMPQNAIEDVPIDVVARADEIGRMLGRLMATPRPLRSAAQPAVDDVTRRALEGATEMHGRPSRSPAPTAEAPCGRWVRTSRGSCAAGSVTPGRCSACSNVRRCRSIRRCGPRSAPCRSGPTWRVDCATRPPSGTTSAADSSSPSRWRSTRRAPTCCGRSS